MSTAAEHLDEGQQPLPMPDPEKGKIKELTEYCRSTSTWPEGWTKMKAAEKRKAFRRQFCPEASATFDPSDPLHLISERVENLSKDDVMPAIKRLSEGVGMNNFELGGVLARCTEKGWYSEFGYDTAKEWVEDQTDMKYRKAQYLVRIYTKFVELEIPWGKLEPIGWSKLGMLADVINQENADHWMEVAKALSRRLLGEEIKKTRGASSGSEESDEGSSGEAKTKLWSVRLYPDQEETVNSALEKIAEDSGKEGRGVCLEFMAAACLAGQFGIQDLNMQPAAPEVPEDLESLAAAMKALFLRAKDLAETDYDALEPILAQVDEVFPDADITVEAD